MPDPGCRFAQDNLWHQCVRNTGQPIRPGETCYYENAVRLVEDAHLVDLSEREADWDSLLALHGDEING